MLTMTARAVLFSLCAGGFALASQAQVVRCTDGRTGQVTYTDGACANGASAHEVEPRKTREEVQQERQQAAEALERKQQRLQAEALQAQAQALRDAEESRSRAAQDQAGLRQPQDYARSAECTRSRRALDVASNGLARSTYEQQISIEAAQRQMDLDCLGPQGYAEVEKARANQPRVVVAPSRLRPGLHDPYAPGTARPQPAPRLTQCGDHRCTDNLGNTYPRNGPGRFPGAGGTCSSVGGKAPC